MPVLTCTSSGLRLGGLVLFASDRAAIINNYSIEFKSDPDFTVRYAHDRLGKPFSEALKIGLRTQSFDRAFHAAIRHAVPDPNAPANTPKIIHRTKPNYRRRVVSVVTPVAA